MRYFILYTVLLLCAVTANGQPVYFRHYQVEDGLANNTVFSAFQDARGFMWFGTKEGLNRFDGGAFRTFNMKQDNQQDAKEFVYSIREGIHQTLWVGTRKGLYEFDPRTEIFSLLDPTRDSEILDIKSDGKGKIWFTSDLRLYCYDERKHTTRHYDLRMAQSLWITGICISKDQTVWACSVDGYIFRYDTAKDVFHCVNTADGQRLWEVNRIYCTPSGLLLIGTIRSLSCYDPMNGSYRPLLGLPVQEKPVYVRDILLFAANEYWIATESGIYIVDLETGRFINMRQQDANPYAISDNAVYALCRDTEGGIWCGTYFGGVNYYHSRHSYFRKYFRNSSPHSLSGNAIRELCADGRGNLWVGTEDAGLNKLDLASGEVTRFSAPGTLSSTNIHALLIDGNELWVGTFQQGLDVLDLHTGRRLRHYNADPAANGLLSNFIISACRTRAGEILLGTSYGIYRYQRSTGRFVMAREFPENSYVFCLYEDRDGIIWAGTIGKGLYYYNARTGEKGNFVYNAGDSNSLGSNSVCGIFQDSDQHLWISTEGGGVCKLNKDRRSFTRFNTASGLPSNMVYKVLEDKSKRLWISTSQGLARYDPAQNSWKVYTRSHGLLTDQFNYSSGYRDSTGTLYFGSVKGLISFDPDLLAPDKASPPVYITSFQVNNQDLPISRSTMPYSVSFMDTVTLAYDRSSFAIGFAALTYIAADMTQYAYRLDGLDKDWTYLPANRKAYFTGLAPGDYTFRVRTAGNDGSWRNREETRLLIRIAPPWWSSPFAYAVYAGLLLVLIYALVSAYHRRQKEKHKRRLALFEQEKEKEIYKAKIEFFTNVAHEIRTPLTLIKGPLEMVIDEVGEQPGIKKSLQSIERNTERLVALTDQLLDFRKTENQGFSLSFVKAHVPWLVQENYQAFATAARQRSLSYNIELPEKGFHAFIDIEAFHKIMSNLIGNAVKYAAQQVVVRVLPPSGEPGMFRIEVGNDGALIPWTLREKIFEPFFRIRATEQPGSGIGLSLSRALTQLHNGVLELQQADSNMNIFVLRLPVHQNIEFRLSSVEKKSF
ncbi:ligand-binding sensor domain-containing protein [Chitinophaga japonensis]|uniref:histidine kinase n=1 Tax=Chitinophaga japonensis TaxID=104662 RepID=A0A562T2J3_CHIJA|nr:sensor histidine kinase [Chitinophaga japonensis]TWI87861.1 two component regulator with propeller domain [Chitinophaga japonensis]